MLTNSSANLVSDAHVRRVRHNAWFFVLWLVLLLLLYTGGELLQQALRYDRTAILDGQYWRLLTAHFVHLDARHVLLNVSALVLIAALLVVDYSPIDWGWVVLCSAISIDLKFFYWMPELSWYVGSSGVLHGLLAAGAVAWWRKKTYLLAAALTAILVGKLFWEQFIGQLQWVGTMPVITEAHLYGALGGLTAGLLLQYRRALN